MTDNSEFIHAPIDIANAESGGSDLTFRTNRVPDEVAAVERANRHLKNRGGRGDGRTINTGGIILSINESVAITIAKDMIDDAQRRHHRMLKDLTLIELNEGIDLRCKGRIVSPAEVGAEIARLQNNAIYGAAVPRR